MKRVLENCPLVLVVEQVKGIKRHLVTLAINEVLPLIPCPEFVQLNRLTPEFVTDPLQQDPELVF